MYLIIKNVPKRDRSTNSLVGVVNKNGHQGAFF